MSPASTQILPTISPPNVGARGTRIGLAGRLAAAGIAASCLLVLAIAARIDPARSGMGTHLQIGLAPCGFQQQTGLPCGTCGMTTSFAHFVRGNVIASAFVQPFGFVAAIATAATVWIAGHAAVTGRTAYRVMRRLPFGWSLGAILSLWILAWAWKVFIVVRGMDGW